MPDPFVERSFYRNGQVRQEKPLLNGQLHGLVRAWHKNGVLASEEPYQEGKLHGACHQWDTAGKLLGSYVMDHGTGTQCEWWENGRLKMEVSTLDGAFHGISRQWLMDGTLVFQSFFHNGKEADREHFVAACAEAGLMPSPVLEVASPETPTLVLKEHELFTNWLLNETKVAEARQWLVSATGAVGQRNLGPLIETPKTIEFLEAVFNSGAQSVLFVDLYSNPKGDEFCNRLLIRLPDNPIGRNAVRDRCQQLCRTHQAALQPDADIGEKFLYLSWC